MGDLTMNTPAGRGTAGPRIQQATAADVPVLGRLIADAFAELEPNLWLVPDVEARPYVFPAYFALQVDLGVQQGTVYTTPQRDAVAVWLPVVDTFPTLPDYNERLIRLAGSWADRFHIFEAALGSHHPALGRHDYLAFLAVHPTKQRLGLGTRLMEHHHDRVLDHHRLPAYLEAASWHSHDFYRQRGWDEHTDPYQITPTGPTMYPMVRQPRPTSGGQL